MVAGRPARAADTWRRVMGPEMGREMARAAWVAIVLALVLGALAGGAVVSLVLWVME